MICVPIIAKHTGEAREKIARANPIADILELRLDHMESFCLEDMLRDTTKPVIATYRSQREGGSGSADYTTVARCLLNAIDKGADFVDVEFSMPLEFRHRFHNKRDSCRLIISAHLLAGTPSHKRLVGLFRELAATGADIVKIVTYATCWEDNFRVLELIPKARAEGIKIIAFCMGPMGQMSRIFSCLMGGYATFASLDPGQESAPGQIPVTKMKELLEMLSI